MTTTYLNRNNGVLRIPQDILDVFNKANQTYGFTNIIQQATNPRSGTITIPGNPEGDNYRIKKRQGTCGSSPKTPNEVAESRVNCYGGCATWSIMIEYLLATRSCFDPYSIRYNCTYGPDETDFIAYLNSFALRTAIHAPSKTYEFCNKTIQTTLAAELVEPPEYRIMPAILQTGIKVHLYSGNDDAYYNHIGNELSIQNMTWNRCQGFECAYTKPFVVNGQHMGNSGYEVRPTPFRAV